jgi:DNA-binding phage protein
MNSKMSLPSKSAFPCCSFLQNQSNPLVSVKYPNNWVRKGRHSISLTARMSAKAALYIAVRETGISKSELARRLGVDEKEIRRMLSPRHQTKLPRIEQALSALGYQLSVSLLKAA